MPVIPRIFGGPQTTPVVPSWFDDFSATNYALANPDLALAQLSARYRWLFARGAQNLAAGLVGAPDACFATTGVWPDAANSRLNIRGTGQAGVTFRPKLNLVPRVWGDDLNGLAQYSELKIVTDSATANNATTLYGPSVFGSWPTHIPVYGGYYFLQKTQFGIGAALYTGGGTPSLNAPASLLAGPFPCVVGDTLRIEVRPSATQHVVTVLINAVAQATVTITPAAGSFNVLTQGLPAICFYTSQNVAVTQLATVTNFSAGPL